MHFNLDMSAVRVTYLIQWLFL